MRITPLILALGLSTAIYMPNTAPSTKRPPTAAKATATMVLRDAGDSPYNSGPAQCREGPLEIHFQHGLRHHHRLGHHARGPRQDLPGQGAQERCGEARRPVPGALPRLEDEEGRNAEDVENNAVVGLPPAAGAGLRHDRRQAMLDNGGSGHAERVREESAGLPQAGGNEGKITDKSHRRPPVRRPQPAW
jgi:hypothetical protein